MTQFRSWLVRYWGWSLFILGLPGWCAEWRVGENLVQAEKSATLVRTLLEPDAAPKVIDGNLISVCRNGLVLEGEEGLVFRDWSGSTRGLSKWDGLAVFGFLPFLDGPAALDQEHQLRVWQRGIWHEIPLPNHVEYHPPGSALYGAQGINIRYPDLLSRGSHIWIYQAKTGSFQTYDLNNKKLSSQVLPKDCFPVRMGDRLAWAGWPKKNQLGLAGTGGQLSRQQAVKLADLDKNSLVYATKTGAWTITFGTGMREALKSWKKGSLAVVASFLTVQAGRLKVQSYEVDKVRIDFQLRTSPSGSPRLSVKPISRFLPVIGSDGLALVDDGRMRLLVPSEPAIQKLRLPGNLKGPTHLVLKGGQIVGYDRRGGTQLIGGFKP